jgi:hypothetical protein
MVRVAPTFTPAIEPKSKILLRDSMSEQHRQSTIGEWLISFIALVSALFVGDIARDYMESWFGTHAYFVSAALLFLIPLAIGFARMPLLTLGGGAVVLFVGLHIFSGLWSLLSVSHLYGLLAFILFPTAVWLALAGLRAGLWLSKGLWSSEEPASDPQDTSETSSSSNLTHKDEFDY